MYKKILINNLVFILISSIFAISLTVEFEPAELIHDLFHHNENLEHFELDDMLLGVVIAFGLMLIYWVFQLKQMYSSELLLNKERIELQALLTSLPIAIAKLNTKQQLTFSNPKLDELTKKIGQTALNDSIKQLLSVVTAKENASSIASKQCYSSNYHDKPIHIEWFLHQGKDNSYLLQGHDISQFEQDHQQLVIAEQIINNTPIGVMVVDSHQEIEYVNNSFELITGYSADEIMGKAPSILKSGRHDPKFYRSMYSSLDKNGSWQGEIWNRRKNGSIFLEWLSITTLKDSQGEITHMIGMFSEITAQEHIRDKLHSLAYYDSLTSLANRTLFNDRLEHLIQNRTDKALCVVFIDLDEFKRINDSLGHDIGDQLLITFAKRLKYSVRSSDVVARWGGDEFIIAIQVSNSHRGIARFCKKQLQLLDAPFMLNGRELNVTASIGVSVYGKDAQTTSELIRNADIAMYQAKKRGRNRYEIFSSQLHKDISENIEIEERLRLAIRKRQIEVYFQPQVKLKHTDIVGFEALARWTDEELGAIPPPKFITIAEDTGLIGDLGELILDKALNQFKLWHDTKPSLTLSLNLSASQLQNDDLIPMLKGKISELGINPQQIKLEITEDIFISNIEKSIHITAQLKKIGFQISLDDFGTGYSSLSYLKDFDIDELKIDRSFVKNIQYSERNKAIVAAMLVMAETLSIDCIVEGVETEQQLNELQNIGCTLFQGYLFYKPMPSDQIEKIYASTPQLPNHKQVS